MSLEGRLATFVTAVATDIKQLRTWITGSSSGDLTGLTTTDKTSVVAAINEVKAGATGSPPSATESTAGVAEIATQTETNTGTDDARIVTPLKLQTRMAAYAQPLDSDLTAIAALSTTTYGRAFLALADQAALQTLLGLDTDTGLAANSDTKIATQKAVKAYVDGIIDANNAFQYKGGIDCSTNPNYPAASAGWTYRVTVAGKIGGASGVVVEIGDTLSCLVDSTAAGNQATVGANWLVLQTNIDGAVVGPASSTAAHIATFSGSTGKAIQDSGVVVSTDGTLASNVDTKLPTEKALLTYLGANYYNQTNLGDPETDLAAAYAAAKA